MAANALSLPKWFVMVVPSLTHRRITALLQKLGLEFYLPLQKQLHYWSDRKKWVDVPILRPYVFLHTTETGRDILFNTSSAFRFLRSNGQLATARQKEIDDIRLLCTYGTNMQLEPVHARTGDTIKIVAGPLAGLHGSVLHENGSQRLQVQIASLGRFASVEVDSSYIQHC